jgi:hypothetical protein
VAVAVAVVAGATAGVAFFFGICAETLKDMSANNTMTRNLIFIGGWFY